MDKESKSSVSTTDQTTTTPTTPTTQPSSSPDNKRLVMIVGAVVGALLLVLIVLAIMLLSRDDKADTTDNTGTTTEQQQDSSNDNSTAQQGSSREVLMTLPTSDDKLEYIIYKPQQNSANTTLHFAVRNTCEGCSDSTPIWDVVSQFDSQRNSYLIDDNNGRKYSTITDEDSRVLATPRCNAHLKYDEKQECFVAFSKVPSGSTVSWVFGNNRIDNIKVE